MYDSINEVFSSIKYDVEIIEEWLNEKQLFYSIKEYFFDYYDDEIKYITIHNSYGQIKVCCNESVVSKKLQKDLNSLQKFLNKKSNKILFINVPNDYEIKMDHYNIKKVLNNRKCHHYVDY